MEDKKKKLSDLIAKTKENLDGLLVSQQSILSEISSCQRIIKECELSILLLNKMDSLQSVGENLEDIIIEDKLSIVDNFEGRFSHLVEEQLVKLKMQASRHAMNLVKKDEIEKIKEKAVQEYLAKESMLNEKSANPETIE